MARRTLRGLGGILLSMVLIMSACGGDDEGQSDAPGDTVSNGGNGQQAGSSDGLLVLGDEEIELGPGRCYLQEQEAAAGGGSILATAQASGTNAAGEDVVIDFSRYSAESQFAGDDVNINIGPLGDSDFYGGSAPEGTVSIDGTVVSASDFPMNDLGSITFEIHC